ncbi:hypothetical protein [Cellvibrio sp.]|uniref:hypothetical protein n=1 Tax=Cellvibrio sp. TaxID=1965322 RepID=UPI003F4BB3B9
MQVSSKLIIPESVMSSPWEYLDCASCEEAISKTIDEQLTKELKNPFKRFSYWMHSRASGTVIQKATLHSNKGYLMIESSVENKNFNVKVDRVVDINGNNIPKTKKDAEGARIRVISSEQKQEINYHLRKSGFYAKGKNQIYTIFKEQDKTNQQ